MGKIKNMILKMQNQKEQPDSVSETDSVMTEIDDKLKQGMTEEQLTLLDAIVNDSEYSIVQKQEIKNGILNGLSSEQLKVYANKNIKAENMKNVRKSFFEGGLTIQQAKCFLEYLNRSDPYRPDL